MGTYFNPGNESYKTALNSRIYVDKTGLLELLNRRLGTEEKCVAISHARLIYQTMRYQSPLVG